MENVIIVFTDNGQNPVPVRRQSPEWKRGVAMGMLMEGANVTAVAAHCGVHRNTIYNWQKKFQEDGHLKRKVGSGSTRVTTNDQDAAVVAFAQVPENIFSSAQEIK